MRITSLEKVHDDFYFQSVFHWVMHPLLLIFCLIIYVRGAVYKPPEGELIRLYPTWLRGVLSHIVVSINASLNRVSNRGCIRTSV